PGQAVKTFVLAENPFAAALPISNDFDFSVRRLPALNGLAAAAKNRKKCFDPMNTVPEKVGMVWLKFARAAGLRIHDFAERPMVSRLCVFAETQRRRTEYRHMRLLRQTKDFEHITQRSGHRFVDE